MTGICAASYVLNVCRSMLKKQGLKARWSTARGLHRAGCRVGLNSLKKTHKPFRATLQRYTKKQLRASVCGF
jgi:hypothetical protein